jgi:NAD(P)-dependent dehydrogenase (short-subunit alcohol dehydrogenase family)
LDDVIAPAMAIETFGQIHGLVNNAGINDGIALEHDTTEQFLESLRQNLVHNDDVARFAAMLPTERNGSQPPVTLILGRTLTIG